MEHDTLRVLRLEPEDCIKVPADGLSLAVLIGCQPYGVGLLNLAFEAAHELLLLGRNLIFWLKRGGVYAELLFLEVTDVSVT